MIANQEVSVTETYDLDADPVIGIRAAAIAAQAGLPIAPATLQLLMNAYREGAGEMPNPWPRAARENLISLIGAGQPMVRIWEA
jgi:[protein-PII] uridylyltransferase